LLELLLKDASELLRVLGLRHSPILSVLVTKS
jgi:hypothetical protein